MVSLSSAGLSASAPYPNAKSHQTSSNQLLTKEEEWQRNGKCRIPELVKQSRNIERSQAEAISVTSE